MTFLTNIVRNRIGRAVTTAVFLCVTIWSGSRAWTWICGNQRFSFYGRVIDEAGQGISGVTIDVELFYSDRIMLPVMYGRVERIRKISVLTNDAGYFNITALIGYGLSLRDFTKGAIQYRLADPALSSPLTWGLDQQSERSALPFEPQKRLDYQMVPFPPRSQKQGE